jgi:hypothetical protein
LKDPSGEISGYMSADAVKLNPGCIAVGTTLLLDKVTNWLILDYDDGNRLLRIGVVTNILAWFIAPHRSYVSLICNSHVVLLFARRNRSTITKNRGV